MTVVDAKNLVRHLDEVKPDGAVNEAHLQVACADCILLNKQDLVPPQAADAVQRRVRAINGVAHLVPTTNSRVDLDTILNIRSFDMDRVHRAEADAQHPHRPADDAPATATGGASDHGHTHGDGNVDSCEHCRRADKAAELDAHEHDSSVGTVAVQFDGDIDLDKVSGHEGRSRVACVMRCLCAFHTSDHTFECDAWLPAVVGCSCDCFVCC